MNAPFADTLNCPGVIIAGAFPAMAELITPKSAERIRTKALPNLDLADAVRRSRQNFNPSPSQPF